MSFDIHPAVFATVTILIVFFAWVTFAVTCYLRRREKFGSYDEKDQRDGDIDADLTNVVVAHSGSNFKSSDRGNDTGISNGDNSGNDTDGGGTGGGVTGGSDTGGDGSDGGNTGGGDTGGGGTDGGETGGGDTGGNNSEN